MNTLSIYSLIFLAFAEYQIGSASEWNYQEQNLWVDSAPFCGLNSQSPINIVTKDVVMKDLGEIHYEGYLQTPSEAKLINNGHSLKLAISVDTDNYTITDGGIDGIYQLAQLHFHWGSTDSVGSEHKIDDKQHPLELHLVHFNVKYQTIGASLDHDDGLAVLGIFFEVIDTDNADLKKILDHVDHVKDADSEYDLEISDLFPLKNLLPAEESFYRYKGSLTTPTCNEIVTWTVFKTTMGVSVAQLEQFRSLQDSHSHKIENNFRDTQELNGREVTYSFGSVNVFNHFLSIICIYISYISLH